MDYFGSEIKKREVRNLFLSGGSYTAADVNRLCCSNDARKYISLLRKEGYDIKDIRLEGNIKLYWLERLPLQASKG